MVTIAGIAPQFSAGRDGGESVEITGSGLDAATSVTFGPFEAMITNKTADRLTVTAPDYRPGWGGEHGEVLVWVDTEPTHTNLIWTWAGKSLAELGGPLDDVDQAVGLGSAPEHQWDASDPVDAALRPQEPAEAAGSAPHYAAVDSFDPEFVPTSGGWITLHGRGFTGATAITIGSWPCADFEVRGDDVAVALVPRLTTDTSDLPYTPIVWHGVTPSLMPANSKQLRWRRGTDDLSVDTTPFTTDELTDEERRAND